ncbi:MAG: FecR family protein [Longimicrobiales bacterium]
MSRRADPGMDEIIERSLRGQASESEVARLHAWRKASPANEQQYLRAERLIVATRGLRPSVVVAPPRPSAAGILSTVSARASRRAGRWVPWIVAAAAVLVAALDLREPAQPTGWDPLTVDTGANELATVKLGDGTVVRLAPSSRLQVEGGSTREVTLEGRAFFAVTKVPGQTFRVRTRTATANVLGTRFELATDGAGVRLMVLEGRVALDAPENSVEVGAGEESGVRAGAATPPTRLVESAGAPAWLGKFIVFQATPLRDAAREIERLYDVRMVVADATLADATITATFTDRPVDDVVSVVCAVLNVHCVAGDGVVSVTR